MVIRFMVLGSLLLPAIAFFELNKIRMSGFWTRQPRRSVSSMAKGISMNVIQQAPMKYWPPRPISSYDDSVETEAFFTREDAAMWFLLTKKYRADAVYFPESSDLEQVVSDVWKAIWTSLRVLGGNSEESSLVALYFFPNFKVDNSSITTLNDFLPDIEGYLDSPIFQPSFKRRITSGTKSISNKEYLYVCVETRTKSDDELFGDTEAPLPPKFKFDSLFNNEIPQFPFASVYDFISHVNKPVTSDEANNLRFNFRVDDLRRRGNETTKNFEKFVFEVNCKLTRLAEWRDVLSKRPLEELDPIANKFQLYQQIQLKFKTMQRLKGRPRLLLDRVYDRRSVFINVIDKWSDRLKSNFKSHFLGKRPPPEDFFAPIARSTWRNAVINTTRLWNQTQFLKIEEPAWTPGSPAPIFAPGRYVLWNADFSVEVALFEMLAWLRSSEKVKAYAGLTDESLGYVATHAYSRAQSSERVLHDFWTALHKHNVNRRSPVTNIATASRGDVPLLRASQVYAKLSTKRETSEEEDHTDQYKRSVATINKLIRRLSVQTQQPVRDVFHSMIEVGNELVGWWTDIVRNADAMDVMERVPRGARWSDVIAEFVSTQASRDALSIGGGYAASTAATEAQGNAALWRDKYEPVMRSAESLEQALPWKDTSREDKVSEEGARWLSRNFVDLSQMHEDVVTVNFAKEPVDEVGEPRFESFLFVAPRYFRAIDLSEELSAFLEFESIVRDSIEQLGNDPNNPFAPLEVMGLHPAMVDVFGGPDFGRRAPHPAIVVRRKIA